ncbi:MAG: dihydrofolate reductase [Bacteroidales bacterium]|nr:dihydrofolate reductase [Bacteroidales bacterium]
MISIIVAVAENGAIGKDNDLIWHLSDDLKRFKALTTGHTIVMGRKTYESLPKGALPNRTNVVLTANTEVHFPNCTLVHSIDEIIKTYGDRPEEHFVIGGGRLYEALLPFAEKIYLTKVHQSFDADVFFPEIDEAIWKEESREDFLASEKNEYAYSFINLLRK